MTKRELIQFMDELVELASEENKTKAILVKEKFINDFEKSYEYEKEVQTEVTKLPPYHYKQNAALVVYTGAEGRGEKSTCRRSSESNDFDLFLSGGNCGEDECLSE